MLCIYICVYCIKIRIYTMCCVSTICSERLIVHPKTPILCPFEMMKKNGWAKGGNPVIDRKSCCPWWLGNVWGYCCWDFCTKLCCYGTVKNVWKMFRLCALDQQSMMIFFYGVFYMRAKNSIIHKLPILCCKYQVIVFCYAISMWKG